jgi:hypothetical protein
MRDAFGKWQDFDLDLHLSNTGIAPTTKGGRRHFRVAGVVDIEKAQPEFTIAAGLSDEIDIRRKQGPEYLGARRNPAFGKIVRYRWLGSVYDGNQKDRRENRFSATGYQAYARQARHFPEVVSKPFFEPRLGVGLQI